MFTMDNSLHNVIRQNGKVLNGKNALVFDFCYANLLLNNLDMHNKSVSPFHFVVAGGAALFNLLLSNDY